MSKKLDETMILNELKGGSSFFHKPETATTTPSPVPAQPKEIKDVRTEDTSVLPDERTTVRTNTRRTIRHPFEIYEDQLSELRRLKAMFVLEGSLNVSMSEMVRQALDNFIRDNKKA